MKEIYRSIVKVLDNMIDSSLECEWMDNEMDGSGDCGGIIHQGHNQFLKSSIEELFKKYNLNLFEFWIWLQNCSQITMDKNTSGQWDVKTNILQRWEEVFNL